MVYSSVRSFVFVLFNAIAECIILQTEDGWMQSLEKAFFVLNDGSRKAKFIQHCLMRSGDMRTVCCGRRLSSDRMNFACFYGLRSRDLH